MCLIFTMNRFFKDSTVASVDNLFRPKFVMQVISLILRGFCLCPRDLFYSQALCCDPLVMNLIFVFRIHGHKIMSHQEAAIFTARRMEMCEIVESTLLYLQDRPVVHSEVSALPFLVSMFLVLVEVSRYIITNRC